MNVQKFCKENKLFPTLNNDYERNFAQVYFFVTFFDDEKARGESYYIHEKKYVNKPFINSFNNLTELSEYIYYLEKNCNKQIDGKKNV
ncbi:MAG: hypothetical protein PVF17_00860 [Ignavibacteria bacterium]